VPPATAPRLPRRTRPRRTSEISREAEGRDHPVPRDAGKFLADNKALAATEFAVIVPVMLVMFFGTVEISSAVAVDRKVTLIARTLSDWTSQSSGTLTDANLQNMFTASMSIITPYDNTLVNGTIAQIYIDANSVAKIQWSKSAVIASGATQASLTAPPPTLAANTPRSRR
jgi:Flp pilus assembly protein TadG